MKIFSFLLVQTFLIANIAQADFSSNVPDKMPESHFQNRVFRKPTIEPTRTIAPEDVPKIRTKRICPDPKVIRSQEAKAIQVTAPPKPTYASWRSTAVRWGAKAAVWGGKALYRGARWASEKAIGGAITGIAGYKAVRVYRRSEGENK